MLQSPGATLVPAPLYQPRDNAKYLVLSGTQSEQENVLHFRLHSTEAHLLFCVRKDLNQQALALLNDVILVHTAGPLIESSMRESLSKPEPSRLYLNVLPGLAELVLVRSNELILYNSYPIHEDPDLVYFVLNAFNQFSLPQENTPVIISGWPEQYAEGMKILDGYAGLISMAQLNTDFLYSEGFKSVGQHHVAQLINLAECALLTDT